MLKRTISLCLLLTITAACEEEAPPFEERVRAIKTITVSDVASGQNRRFPAVIDAVDTTVLSFEVAGNVKEVLVSPGDRVEVGQVLALLDETPFRLNVQAAEAEVGQNKASLAEKETEYSRQDTLFKKGWVAKAAFDQALAARDSAKNQVAYAVSKLNLARRDLDKAALVAPFAGVISSQNVDSFQEVSRGEPIFELYAEGAMEATIAVPETTVSALSLGLNAEITFAAEQLPMLEGRISEIGSVASEANAFQVKVALLNPGKDILPGMTAEVAMTLSQGDQSAAFLVPISALAESDRPQVGYVFIFDPESQSVTKTEVRGSGVRDDFIVISEGLNAGDIIAVAGVSFLRDGQTVRLMTP